MTNINKLCLAGRLTRDPEMRFTDGGMAIARMGCVVNERRKKGDQWIDEAVFMEVTMFGKRAEAFANHPRKGSEFCFPDARLAYDTWEGKDGEKRQKLYVIANGFEFIGGKQEANFVPDDKVPF